MREARPTEAQRFVLRRAAEAGVVLDYVLVSHGRHEAPSEGLHREALRVGLTAASARRECSTSIGHHRAAGRQISVETFYGWNFDPSGRRLRMPASPPVMLTLQQRGRKELPGFGPFQWADDDDPDHAFYVTDEMLLGYAHGFVDPPHSIRLTPRATQELFLEIDELLLGSPTAGAEIWWWDGGNWAEYFDAGLEWWGAWAATIRTSATTLTVVCASTTD